MQYYQHHKVNVIIDLLGILFLFGLGIGGLIFVSNPIEGLVPTPPMLTTSDWAGSASYFGIEEERTTIEERDFSIHLNIGKGSVFTKEGAIILQRAIWYADSAKSVEALKNPNRLQDFSEQLQLVEKNLTRVTLSQKDKPASKLYCSEFQETGFICGYFAYSGHWYTEVWFWSGSDTWLSFSTAESLIERVNVLLLSAPPLPEKYDIFN
jgi:hypothetical protein